MLTNLLNVWLLARVMQSAVAAALGVLGAALGVSIAWRWRAGQSDEVQLTLERQAELVAAVMHGLQRHRLLLFRLAGRHCHPKPGRAAGRVTEPGRRPWSGGGGAGVDFERRGVAAAREGHGAGGCRSVRSGGGCRASRGVGVVAPYALATPGHLCPFCLLHAQGGWLGWPLFGALFAGTVTGLAWAWWSFIARQATTREPSEGFSERWPAGPRWPG